MSLGPDQLLLQSSGRSVDVTFIVHGASDLRFAALSSWLTSLEGFPRILKRSTASDGA